jgi:undecaprenyl pyrophosphate phosphatase UppP
LNCFSGCPKSLGGRYVQSHTFNLFGWYRIALAILIFALTR